MTKVIIENFLDDFDSFREHCDEIDYAGQTNPADGVFYPDVSVDIPDKVREEILSKLASLFKSEIKVNLMFLRLSKKGTPCPHQAHTDSAQAGYTFMLYLNREQDCVGGTSLVTHKDTDLYKEPTNSTEWEIWNKDKNNPDEWLIYDMADMRPNRACIFPSALMHRAEPVGGFGDTTKDGRLVLTCFFDV